MDGHKTTPDARRGLFCEPSMTAAAAEINPRFVVVADLLICPARDRFRHSASQMDAQKEIARIDDDDTWAVAAMRRYTE